MTIEFYGQDDGAEYGLRKTLVTNADGRTDEPVLHASEAAAGRYQLIFHLGDYFAATGVELPQPRFFDRVPVRFAIANVHEHYHVPILAAPWGYTTYRGS